MIDIYFDTPYRTVYEAQEYVERVAGLVCTGTRVSCIKGKFARVHLRSPAALVQKNLEILIEDGFIDD